ncbi:unnamed protein product, partial [Symbiodinium microadriaticum]
KRLAGPQWGQNAMSAGSDLGAPGHGQILEQERSREGGGGRDRGEEGSWRSFSC